MERTSTPLSLPIGLALTLSSAVLAFAAGEPLGIGPLAFVAPAPLLIVLFRSGRIRAGLGYGLLFGLAYFGVVLWWIFLFGWMAWVGLVVFMALYGMVAMAVAAPLSRMPMAPVLIAGAWTGAELLRDRYPFGGYSWGSLGTSLGAVPVVRWLAGVVGVYGLCFLAVLVAAAIAQRIATGRTGWGGLTLAGLVLVGFVWADLATYGPPSDDRKIEVAVVQGNVPRPVQPGQRDAILRSHVELTEELLGDGAPDPDRVVVWPEDSIGIGVSPGALGEVERLASTYATPILAGRSLLEGTPGAEEFLNTVVHVDATGRLEDTYQKRHPVPFGEYVPIEALRRYVGTLESEIPTDQVPGTRANVFDVDGTMIATPICFESVFPRDILDFARNGAELYVLMTNDASFERSYASEQHLAHLRMRALETRQWAVQAALSGISATIAPDGEISHATDLFEATTFTAEVGVRPSHSLYAKTGDLFAFIAAGGAAVATLVAMIRRRRAPS